MVDARLEFESALWSQGITCVAGVDEVGAGPLAGPVYAAAVILPVGFFDPAINDSKKLTRRKRDAVVEVIRTHAFAFAFGSCTPEEIDQLNILQASREAMRRAVAGLLSQPQHILVDARVIPNMTIPQTAIIKGDSRSQTIAAASILAKVERDGVMASYAGLYPGYGFDKHQGYGTQAHLDALQRLGPCPIHRRSFAPVAAQLGVRQIVS